MSKVYFTKPIEACHEDGRVVAVTDIRLDGINWVTCQIETHPVYFMDSDGTAYGTGWRIRNVTEPKDDVPEWAVKRAQELSGDERGYDVRGYSTRAFARYIAAHEDEPIDPDLLEARQIEYEICAAQDIHDPEQALRGEWDDREGLKGVLRAIKRGRILERGEGK